MCLGIFRGNALTPHGNNSEPTDHDRFGRSGLAKCCTTPDLGLVFRLCDKLLVVRQRKTVPETFGCPNDLGGSDGQRVFSCELTDERLVCCWSSHLRRQAARSSFPRRREPINSGGQLKKRRRLWMPACAGMTIRDEAFILRPTPRNPCRNHHGQEARNPRSVAAHLQTAGP